METVNCDFCGKSESTPVTQQTDKLHNTTSEQFTIVKCNNCGLQYTNPRPTTDEIGKYYSSDYAFHSASNFLHRVAVKLVDKIVNSVLGLFILFLPGINKRLVPYIKPKISDPVREYYKNSISNGTFLDIGCGAGANAHFWGESGSLRSYKKITEVAGIEVSPVARQSLKKAGIESWASLDEVPDNRCFSVIRMNWSLEHVHSPSMYFDFISKHLSKNGLIIIAVPNYDGLIYKIAPDCVELPIHLYHFNAKNIYDYADKFGMNVNKLITFSYPQMFTVAAKFGLLPSTFSKQFSFHNAMAFQKILSRFDDACLGNDLIAILELKE